MPSEFAECDDSVARSSVHCFFESCLLGRRGQRKEILRESRQPQRPNRKQKRNDDFAFKWLVDGHSKEVERQDDPGER